MRTLMEEISDLVLPMRDNPAKWEQVKSLIGKTWDEADLWSFRICYRSDLTPGVDLEEFDGFIKKLREIAAA